MGASGHFCRAPWVPCVSLLQTQEAGGDDAAYDTDEEQRRLQSASPKESSPRSTRRGGAAAAAASTTTTAISTGAGGRDGGEGHAADVDVGRGRSKRPRRARGGSVPSSVPESANILSEFLSAGDED